MKSLVILLLINFLLIQINAIDWESYKRKYDKTYDPDEDEYRKNLFLKTVERIQEHNRRYYINGYSFQMGLNKFADMTDEEFTKSSSSGVAMPPAEFNAIPSDGLTEHKAPNSINWVVYGFNTTVMDQEDCGCCYAMASICSIEGHYYIKHNVTVKLSEQEVIDCSKNYGNKGCNFGFAPATFKYIKHKGVGPASKDPYQDKETKCHIEEPRYYISHWYKSAQNDEIALMEAVSRGPVMVLIYANLDSFRYYKSGIYNDPECRLNPQAINHFVTILGYGINEYNEDYWLIKNSWGNKWGSDGYMYMARNSNNTCGIAYQPVYPKLP